MVRYLSTALAVALLASTLSCVDARGRLDEFANRVIDGGASTIIDAPPVAEVADINGQFLLTIDPVPIAPGKHIRYIADVTMTRANGDISMNMEMRAVDFQTLELVDPPVEPETWQDVVVNPNTGELELVLDATLIPGKANAAVPGLDVTVTGAMRATIRSADLWCGTVSGQTNLGTSLAGSTFGAIRIEPGTLGANLPDPVPACPSGEAPDAGVPDAGAPDAALPDAAPTDAN